jgi:hypothetical protein
LIKLDQKGSIWCKMDQIGLYSSCAEEICHFKLMFSANLASQFGHL